MESLVTKSASIEDASNAFFTALGTHFSESEATKVLDHLAEFLQGSPDTFKTLFSPKIMGKINEMTKAGKQPSVFDIAPLVMEVIGASKPKKK